MQLNKDSITSLAKKVDLPLYECVPSSFAKAMIENAAVGKETVIQKEEGGMDMDLSSIISDFQQLVLVISAVVTLYERIRAIHKPTKEEVYKESPNLKQTPKNDHYIEKVINEID